jgi:uncharacterized protein
MHTLRFEWDQRKAAANAKKHGVSFEEAKSVFVDERAKLIETQTTLKMKSVLFFWV